MKKFFISIFIFLGILSYSYANESCSNFLDFSWSTSSNQATFTMKSTSSKPIWITKFEIYTGNGDVMKSFTRNSSRYGTTSKFVLHLNRYGTNSHTVSISDLNPDLLENAKANYWCTFKQPERRKVQNLNIKDDKSWFKWQYIFLVPLAFVFFGWVLEQFQGSKTNKKSKRLRPKQYSDYTTNTENFFEDVWEGRKPLGESFWLYFVVINFIISFVSAFLMEYFDNKIFLLPLIGSNIWVGVGTWKSSDNYQKKKIQQKQGYGWAYTAKVFIALNFLALLGNVIDIFNA